MSEYQESLQVFIDLVNNEIVSAEDLADLLKVVEESSEDDEEIAIQIDSWLEEESRSEIKEAYMANLSNLSDSGFTKLGFGGTKMKSGKRSESSRKLLINAIKRNTYQPKKEESSKDKSLR